MFKDRPIWQQLFILFAGFCLLIGILLFLIIPPTLKGFFTKEIYQSIEESQNFNVAIENRLSDWKREPDKQTIRSVQHVVLDDQGRILKKAGLTKDVINRLYLQALSQNSSSKRYSVSINGQELLYVIKKGQISGKDFILISYLWDTYRKELVHTLLRRIYLVLFFILAFAVFISIFFSKWIVKPLLSIKGSVNKISQKNWKEPIVLERGDEIGELAKSIESMRKQLVIQDEAQQALLQHASHDLKTPVMVIRSYLEAISDGIYPTGDFDGTLSILKHEAESMEKKIGNLLYITKLEYLSTKPVHQEPIDLKDLILSVCQRLSTTRGEIQFEYRLLDCMVKGDLEQWKIFMENLISNSLKYARSIIDISMEMSGEGLRLTVFNDGMPIEEKVLQELYQPFVKGSDGHFGLGMYIMKKIADRHEVEFSGENISGGVRFSVHWKKAMQKD
ncbi:sensor histidine kinase [Falsibacillus albus]|uniref:histidine kinase n=1 Tax=Falsibacillus albus TaxID=2478915 RepID=A0A3L7K2P1_9BACI|nr:HAMP domain-containing sensor histidine kinase [Falsibacillus albus]RLQ97336.1 sensor histidine kinase [Falsibacillus albus]